MRRACAILLATLLAGSAFSTEADDNKKSLADTVAQIQADSHVVAIMMGKIHNLVIVACDLQGADLGTTELDGATITIKIDVGKVLRNHHSLVNTVIHELTHADDIARWPVGFAKLESEDRALPWADRRLEKRAIQRTGAITAYLAMQYPGRYEPSVHVELE